MGSFGLGRPRLGRGRRGCLARGEITEYPESPGIFAIAGSEYSPTRAEIRVATVIRGQCELSRGAQSAPILTLEKRNVDVRFVDDRPPANVAGDGGLVSPAHRSCYRITYVALALSHTTKSDEGRWWFSSSVAASAAQQACPGAH